MPSTTNFNWTTPADTDLVKDGAAAIRTLGNGIDTSLVDLKGGTTGQILSKASNTDLDYTWINNDQGDITAVTAGTGISGGGTTGSVTITNDMATTITAAGDIVVGTGNATYDNLPIGTTGQVLTADTTVSPYKVKWASVGAGANWSLLNSGGTSLSGASTVTVSGISGVDKIMVLVENADGGTAQPAFFVRLNTDTGNNYSQYGVVIEAGSTYAASNTYVRNVTSGDAFLIGGGSTNAASDMSAWCQISGCNASGVKVLFSNGGSTAAGGSSNAFFGLGGFWNNSATVTSVSIYSNGGNMDGGTVYVYTSA